MPVKHESTYSPEKRALFIQPLILLVALTGLFITARVFNLQEYLQEDRLRQFIAGCGLWGPCIYLLIWAVVPTLFLPCLPITLAGGVLFGPVWGVIYAAVGSTTGASLAFLVARYLARSWVAVKISGTRLSHLDERVAQHGWKIVALTRLIPVFPYFVVNYAFGLTRVSFLPYAIATFFAMLPWTIAFILVSSNLLSLLQGQVSIWLIIGLVLVVVVSLLPAIYKRAKARQGESVDI